MEEEYDLRPYISILVDKWYLIVGAAVLSAIVALAVTYIRTPQYEATALVAVSEPSLRVQFDPRIQDVSESQPIKAYPELAMSDIVLYDLLTAVDIPDINTVEELQGILSTKSSSDSTVIWLTAVYEDPAMATELVNAWANLFVTQIDAIYGSQEGSQLQFYEQQLVQTKSELDETEQSLIDFQSRNRSTIVSNELNALNQMQSDYLATRGYIVTLTQDIQALQEQFTQQTGSPTFSDQLARLLLQVRAFNTEVQISDSALSSTQQPIQLQIDSDTMTNLTRQEQISFLQTLQETLNGRLTQIDTALVEIEPEILSLQRQKQEIETEELQLTVNRDVAVETYTSLSRKVAEEQITSQNVNTSAKIASQAISPNDPAGQSTLVIMVIAGIVGTIVTAGALWMSLWWESEMKEPTAVSITPERSSNGQVNATPQHTHEQYQDSQ